MLSKYSSLKSEAIRLRKNGISIPTINKTLGIPKSTLSDWLRNITLTPEQISNLNSNWYNANILARKKASLAHRQQKIARINEAEKLSTDLLSSINLDDKNIQELALAMLYLGEGFKNSFGIGNSNPLILRFFINVYVANFKVKRESIRCELYLRADQDPNEIKKYWSNELKISLENFKCVAFDKRTIGSKTFSDYKGVCALRSGNTPAMRKLMFIANKYCQEIDKKWAVSSAG